MYYKYLITSLLLLSTVFTLFSQQNTDSIEKLDEVLINAKRLSIPFSKKSNTIIVISAKEMAAKGIVSLEEIFQEILGVDVRRRGVKGMQSDLYIRGGNFNQTLLLIDGVKMDDMQSGHHTMNAIISVDNIERIEIIKGAASRIYGQNAMNGAINIVTKNITSNKTKITLNYGSFSNYGIDVNHQNTFKNGGILFGISKQQSKGYRYNTDFSNWNGFFKGMWDKSSILFSYGYRAFGANGFYASPNYKEQYEETQTYLLSLKRIFTIKQQKIHANIYWRRNQDMYLFLRNDPDFYRNVHTNDKYGVSFNTSFLNSLGKTGVGIDLNRGFLESNNLGNHQRTTTTMFIEHRIQLLSKRMDITPGIALAYYSDFNFFTYPGIDVGYHFTEALKAYISLGQTSRIPTYTNLYYSSPREIGNAQLKPETAFTYDIGVDYTKKNYTFSLVYFNRKSVDLIDWIKESETDKWQAYNYNKVYTQGIEVTSDYSFMVNGLTQKIHLGFQTTDDTIVENEVSYSRYALNSFKQRIIGNLQINYSKLFRHSISFSYNKRLDKEMYTLVNTTFSYTYKKWKISVQANNLLDAEYTETNLVPMPKSNFMTSLSFNF